MITNFCQTSLLRANCSVVCPALVVHKRFISQRKWRRLNKIKYEGRRSVEDAILQLRKDSKRNFVESLELAVNLFLDPRKPDQAIRTTCILPHGTGRPVKIAVFAEGDKAEDAKNAGADVVGTDDLVEQIMDGKVDFDRVFATPTAMKYAGKVARILGPKKLMPSAKLQTVTNNIEMAVKTAKTGDVVLKTQRLSGAVQCTIGKLSFTDEQLEENAYAVIHKLLDEKPSGAKSRRYFLSAYMSSAMGGSIRLFIGRPPFLRPKAKKQDQIAQEWVVKRYAEHLLGEDNDSQNQNSVSVQQEPQLQKQQSAV